MTQGGGGGGDDDDGDDLTSEMLVVMNMKSVPLTGCNAVWSCTVVPVLRINMSKTPLTLLS